MESSISRISRARDALQKDYDACEADIQVDNPEQRLIYDNQKEVALEIVDSFMNNDVYLAVLIAEMQVGKTGACLGTAFYMCTHSDDSKIIDRDNVITLTGLSDTEWKTQTKMSMINSFARNVFHRGNFKDKRLLDILKNGSNMLIIVDESHIASQISQQMSLLLKEADILNINMLKARNIRILQVSATPGATLKDALDWGNHSKVFKLKPSCKYVGFKKLREANKIKDALDLSKYQNVLRIGDFITNEYLTPKYHIIRVKGCSNIDKNITSLCVAKGWSVINHNSQDRWDADILEKCPEQHVFILIKDFWRASKRLCDTHIGVVHEAYVKVADANANAQGLAGRCCGNDKQEPGSGTPTIFCNTRAIEQYIAWVNANGCYSEIQEYSSKDIKVSKGRIKASLTINHHSNVDGLDVVQQQPSPLYDFPEWNGTNGFGSLDELKEFLRQRLNRIVRLRDFLQRDGYMLSTRLTNYYGKTKDNLVAEDRLVYADYNIRMAGTNIASQGKKGQHYMVYPVYPNKESPPESVRYYYSILATTSHT